ncbi:unnamed protein product [Discosporangium mesarthrocarpum]
MASSRSKGDEREKFNLPTSDLSTKSSRSGKITLSIDTGRRDRGKLHRNSGKVKSTQSKHLSSLETELDMLKQSLLQGLGHTDLKTIDNGLRCLSSRSETHLGLYSFSDEEDDDDEDDSDSEHSSVNGTSMDMAVLSPGPVAAAARRSAAAAKLGRGGGGSWMSRSRKQWQSPLEQLSLARAQSDEGAENSTAPWSVIKLRSEQEIIRGLDPRFFEAGE